MENPVKFMQASSKTLNETLKNTGGLGTVATRADIIDKLFNTFLIEKKEDKIFMSLPKEDNYYHLFLMIYVIRN